METQGEWWKRSNQNNENCQYGSETLPIVDKQTYLGIEMISSDHYT